MLPSEINELRTYANKEKNSIFISKPESGCQGKGNFYLIKYNYEKGIFITNCLEQFDINERHVIQKYKKNPFLIDGLKFDLRIYVLLAGCDPLRFYIYNYYILENISLHRRFSEICNPTI